MLCPIQWYTCLDRLLRGITSLLNVNSERQLLDAPCGLFVAFSNGSGSSSEYR